MQVMISADMEGASGVTWPDDVRPGTEQWQRFRRMLTSDVNAAVGGLFAAGADEVLVNEAHNTMRNILLEELDPRARILTGRHKPLGMMEGVARAGAVAFVGYHTGAGTAGVLAHTYMGQALLELRINGEAASEGRLNALVAAEAGVPVVLVTGDDLTCADAEKYAPAARTVAVKECVSRYSAICLAPSRTAELIREAAAAALPAQPPEPVEGPWRFEVEFVATHHAEYASLIPTVDMAGPRTIVYTTPTMDEGARCFKAITALAAVAVERDFG